MLDRPGERVVLRAAVAEVLHLRISCRRDRHLISVRQGRYRRRRAVRNAHRVALLAVRHRVLVLRVLRTVVLPLAVSRFDLQFRLVLRDFQRAVLRLDRVVLGQRALVQRVRERVLAAAHDRLAARNVVRRAFTVHEAITAHRYVGLRVLRQRRAVVLLLAVCTRQRHSALRHFQGAVIRGIFVVRVRRFDLIIDCAKVLDAGHSVGPGLTAISAILDRRAFRHARRCTAAMRLTVVLVTVISCLHRHGRRLDRQIAGDEGGLFIIGRNVLTVPCDRIGFGKGTGIRTARNSRALGGSVGYGQDVAVAQAFDDVVIGGDRFTGASDGRDKGAAFLLGAIVCFLDVLNGDRQGRRSDLQGAKLFLYSIVVRVDRTPADGIGVLRATRIGDRASRCDGGLARIRRNEAGETRFSIGQRRAVIGLLSAAGGGSQLRWEDLQTAGTDVQADTVIIVLRQIRKRQTNIIGIIARVGFRDPVIV